MKSNFSVRALALGVSVFSGASLGSLFSSTLAHANATPEVRAATGAAASGNSAKASPGTNNDPITLAVRIVGLESDSGKTTLNTDSAKRLTDEVTKMYDQAGCKIQFTLESFTATNPKDKGLEYNTSSMAALDQYRSAFDDGKSLLVVDTGPWASDMHPANAWTAMPGESKLGAIFEASVADFYQIVGHELGHYLGLDHVSDSSNMMNPVIGDNSTQITQEQCATMRQTAQSTLAAARR